MSELVQVAQTVVCVSVGASALCAGLSSYTPRALREFVGERVGTVLRSVYDAVLDEPVPDTLLELVQSLPAEEGDAPRPARGEAPARGVDGSTAD